MFLVSPHQLNRMTQSIRQTAEDDLDGKMRAILNDKGLSSYEKIKRHGALLQRYRALVKQDKLETAVPSKVPLSSPPLPPSPLEGIETHELDEGAKEAVRSLSVRDRKNALYIMKKLSDSGGSGGWTDTGEFVYKGNVVNGLRLMDLLKNLRSLIRSPKLYRKAGVFFLNLLAELTFPPLHSLISEWGNSLGKNTCLAKWEEKKKR